MKNMKNTLSVMKNIEEHLLDLRKGKEVNILVFEGLFCNFWKLGWLK